MCGSDPARIDRRSIAQEASVPEDQDTLTPARRRTRRQDAAAANDAVNGATEATEATETPAPKRRRSTRAGAIEQPDLPGEMSGEGLAPAAAPATKPRRTRAMPSPRISVTNRSAVALGVAPGLGERSEKP